MKKRKVGIVAGNTNGGKVSYESININLPFKQSNYIGIFTGFGNAGVVYTSYGVINDKYLNNNMLGYDYELIDEEF